MQSKQQQSDTTMNENLSWLKIQWIQRQILLKEGLGITNKGILMILKNKPHGFSDEVVETIKTLARRWDEA